MGQVVQRREQRHGELLEYLRLVALRRHAYQTKPERLTSCTSNLRTTSCRVHSTEKASEMCGNGHDSGCRQLQRQPVHRPPVLRIAAHAQMNAPDCPDQACSDASEHEVQEQLP